MTYSFIVNPAAGRRRHTVLSDRIAHAARRLGLDYEIKLTQHPHHASELAEAAASRYDVVVAVGGDGTIHEVVSGLLRVRNPAHLGIIPAGTGNDFAKMFDAPRDPEAAVRCLQVAHPVQVDLGRVSWDGPAGPGEAVFVNAAGAGIDAKVAESAARFKVLTGTPRYLAAVLRALGGWTPPLCRIEMQRDTEAVAAVEGEMLLVLIANGCCAAGGFYLTPDASIVDGRLDACLVRSTSMRRILALIPRVLRGGRHVGAPEVVLETVTSVHVRTAVPLPVQVDGELAADQATSIRFEVAAGALTVVHPVKS